MLPEDEGDVPCRKAIPGRDGHVVRDAREVGVPSEERPAGFALHRRRDCGGSVQHPLLERAAAGARPVVAEVEYDFIVRRLVHVDGDRYDFRVAGVVRDQDVEGIVPRRVGDAMQCAGPVQGQPRRHPGRRKDDVARVPHVSGGVGAENRVHAVPGGDAHSTAACVAASVGKGDYPVRTKGDGEVDRTIRAVVVAPPAECREAGPGRHLDVAVGHVLP